MMNDFRHTDAYHIMRERITRLEHEVKELRDLVNDLPPRGVVGD